MTEIQGTVADGFEPVREAFAANFATRGDLGAAVSVYRDGQAVVDLWGGLADPESSEPWGEQTAQTVRSVTKGVAVVVPHLLHQRGQLDLDAPVSTYWPEFKQADKERVRVRHLLAHRAGLPALDTPLSPAQAVDGVSGPAALAAQRPAWEPGTAHGYHPTTYNWLLAELVQRATGRSVGRWFAEEVAGPLGLDLWLGLPGDQEHRVGRIVEVAPPPRRPGQGLRTRAKPAVAAAYRDPHSLTRRAFGAIDPSPDENAPAYRAAELPASGGIATARSLARFYATLIGDVAVGAPGSGRLRLFAPATLTQARSQESVGPDRVLVVDTRFGLGYLLHHPSSPMLGPDSFGHPGRGGSLAFADPESGVAFGYVTNSLQKSVIADARAQSLVRAVRGCLRTLP